MSVGGRIFQRRRENFKCNSCGVAVVGDGYTNHCPKCLWSRHVDVNPGDRLSKCGGMMEPVALYRKRGRFVIRHRCCKCNFERLNRQQNIDDRDAYILLAHLMNLIG